MEKQELLETEESTLQEIVSADSYKDNMDTGCQCQQFQPDFNANAGHNYETNLTQTIEQQHSRSTHEEQNVSNNIFQEALAKVQAEMHGQQAIESATEMHEHETTQAEIMTEDFSEISEVKIGHYMLKTHGAAHFFARKITTLAVLFKFYVIKNSW